MKVYLYNYKARLASYEKRLIESDMCTENKQAILKFKQFLVVGNYSLPRIAKYFEILTMVNDLVAKPFTSYNSDDIYKLIQNLQNKEVTESTKVTYYAIIKRFFKWYMGNDETYPDFVKRLPTQVKRTDKKLPNEGELLTEEEVKKLIDAAKNQRDRAFISLLWESGARISEVGTLTIRDVTFDRYGGFITVLGKTGSRKVRIISSIPYIAAWLSVHPCKHSPDSYLWVCLEGRLKGKLLEYRTYWKILKEMFIRCGIKKRSNAHSFRHARATFLANHLTEFQMNQYFGWVQGSDMPSIYVHLTGKNTDDALLKMHGIKSDSAKEESKLKPKVCVRCDTINTNDAYYCAKCGSIQDEKAAIEHSLKEQEAEKKQENMEKYFTELMNDADVKALLFQKLKEKKRLELQATM